MNIKKHVGIPFLGNINISHNLRPVFAVFAGSVTTTWSDSNASEYSAATPPCEAQRFHAMTKMVHLIHKPPATR